MNEFAKIGMQTFAKMLQKLAFTKIGMQNLAISEFAKISMLNFANSL
jgi:chemotaxis protein CheY-P-specific phosphatase CheC